jgi:hypothetical protein
MTMTIADIIALAKQGFKPGDIKEIIELSKTAPKDTEPEKAPEPVKDPEPEKAPEPVKDPEIDYAAEIEKLKSENEKIKKDLAISQEENRRKPGPEIEEESDEEIVQNVLLKLMR